VSGNRYSPPKSVVADPVLGSTRARPHSVTFAAGLLWLGVALVALTTIMALLVTSVAALSVAVFAVPLVVLGVLGAVAHNISRGRHWARIALLVIVALSVPGVLLNVRATLEYAVFTTALSVFVFALQIVALFLVFTGDGARWFRRS
jgi:hypothetical protein